MTHSDIVLRRLGRRDYRETQQAMRDFTAAREADTPDELWLLEHEAVYTQGLNGRAEHLLDPGDTPVIQSDRGGQVTWHGPGQVVIYLLVDMRRRGLGVRQLVEIMENSVIALLAEHGIAASARRDAPGVYVAGAKISALGLRIRHGCSYHGLSLNVDNALEPFARINPCGYPRLPVTRLADLGPRDAPEAVGERLLALLAAQLRAHPARPARRVPVR